MIEVSAFVSPKWVPQMADAAEVFAGIRGGPAPGTPRSCRISPGSSAPWRRVSPRSRFSPPRPRRSAGATSTRPSSNRWRAIGTSARARERAGLRVRGYLSTAFGCPYEGAVAVARVVELSEALVDMGAFEVAVSDTIGIAHPGQVVEVVAALASRVPLDRIALHFHDTRGTALANVLAALDLGVATFDASAGGLGGCPYAPGAAGNLATEDLIFMLDGLGIETGVDLARVVEASRFIESRIGHALPSRFAQAAKAGRSET